MRKQRADLIGNKYAVGNHRRPPKKGQIIKCTICGKDKYYPPSSIKKGAKYCSEKCSQVGSIGRKAIFSDEHKRKISENHHNVKGGHNPNWNGGITKDSYKWRNKNWKKLLSWRKSVLCRDGHKCKDCGSDTKLDAHHIIAISECPDLAFLRMNGVTLCRKCHKKTNNFGAKAIRVRSKNNKFSFILTTIPHNWQDYKTVGNYGYANGTFLIFASEMKDWKYSAMILLHELVELISVRANSISLKFCDQFDFMYEKERAMGYHGSNEPGDDPRCPYRKHHNISNYIERLVSEHIGIDFCKYSDEVNQLG